MEAKGPGAVLIEKLLLESERKGFLEPSAIEKVSRSLSLPSSRVFAVAGSLEHFSFDPPSARNLAVCIGPACALAGSERLLDAARENPGTAASRTRVKSFLGSPYWHLPVMVELDTGNERRLAHKINPCDSATTKTLFGDQEAYELIDLPADSRSRKGLLSVDTKTLWARRRSKSEAGGAGLRRFLLENERAALQNAIRGARLRDTVSGHELIDTLTTLDSASGPSKLLVCDIGGAQIENDAGPTLALLDPQGVIEGTLVAAHAAGADAALLFIPYEDRQLRESLATAIEDFRKAEVWPGVSIRTTAVPNIVPCDREIGIASMYRGLTLSEGVSRAKESRRRLWGDDAVMLDVEVVLRLSHLIHQPSGSGRPRGAVTQVISTGGRVKEPGIADVPQTMTVGQLFADYAGGLVKSGALKAIHFGGAYGGPLRPSALGLRLADVSGRLEGATGGQVLAIDRSTCMVQWSEYFARLGGRLCCGACVAGRLGPSYSERLLKKIRAGQGELSDLEEMRATVELMKQTSLCRQGGRVLNPVLVCLENFAGEFEEHITEKRCAAGVCFPTA